MDPDPVSDPDPAFFKSLTRMSRHPESLPLGKDLPRRPSKLNVHQCCGYMAFWCGSGSRSGYADPCLRLVDPDSDLDRAFFVIDLQDANKILFFYSLSA